MARVDAESATDRTQVSARPINILAAVLTRLFQYTYFNGTGWQDTPVSPDSSDGNVFTSSLSSGDIFYNPYLGVWLAIYFDDFVDNIFWLRYSYGDKITTGGWSDQIQLYVTTPASGKYNYAGHAYPGYDPTGKTILLSWTYDGSQTGMAVVTFA